MNSNIIGQSQIRTIFYLLLLQFYCLGDISHFSTIDSSVSQCTTCESEKNIHIPIPNCTSMTNAQNKMKSLFTFFETKKSLNEFQNNLQVRLRRCVILLCICIRY